MTHQPVIEAFFDEPTNSVSYLVADPVNGIAAVIDPVLGFDPGSGKVSTEGADRILEKAAERGWTLKWLLETHAHADHLSAGDYLRRRTGALLTIGSGIREVQKSFGELLRADDLRPDGSDFDQLVSDGDCLPLGELSVEVIATPGHTPACVSYKIGTAVFVGDTLFMPDYGTARTDFPGGCAHQLYRSMKRLLEMPRETRLFLCHDYKAPGRDSFAWETTVGEQIDCNVHLAGTKSEEDYVAMRTARDKTLCAPKLLYPAIQVNIRAGRLPPPEDNGRSYLKIPVSSSGDLEAD